MDSVSAMTVVPYRCVCGNAIALLSEQSRDCGGCGREVPDTAYRLGDVTVIGEHSAPDTGNDQRDPLLHQKLKHFRVIARLGKGGMGAVYRAVDESLQRDVALKVLCPSGENRQHTSPGGDVTRLLQEARAQARICHPNVVQVYYVDHQDESPFLAMELVRGETLQDRLRRRQLAFPEILDLATQTVRALEAASQYRIVHGDIKPANLLITADGMVKLSDFGLARPIRQLWEGSQPVAGTPNYLSPEGCQGLPTNSRSDMYSLGVMLFEMTFHRLPYELSSKNVSARLKAHVEAPVKFPDEWPDHLPLAWKSLLERLLAKNPQDRFDNHSQLLTELERLAPTDLPRAGRTVRGLAWVSDLVPAWAILELFQATYGWGNTWTESLRGSLGLALSACALVLLALCQAARRASLGKWLFHLRTVDELGQTESFAAMFERCLAQQLPLWLLLAMRGLDGWGLSGAAGSCAMAVLPVLAADVLMALGRRDGRSLHDQWLGTRVVLDTQRHLPESGTRASNTERTADRGRGQSQKHELILRERLLSRSS